MDAEKFRAAAAGAAIAVGVIGAGVFLSEQYDARIALQGQTVAVDAASEQSAAHLTRDLTQVVAVVQGLVALVSARPDVDAVSFANYTRNFRRGRENLRRVFLVRDGKMLFTDRPAASPESFARIERRLAPGNAAVQAAQLKASVVIDGPFKTTENDQVLLYARPIFLGDNGSAAGQFWGFAGVNVDDDAFTCPLGLCEATPAYRMAVRIVVDDQPPRLLAGDAALFEPQAQVVRTFSAIPGARIEIAAMPAAGWIAQSPHRVTIRAVGGTLALFAVGLIFLLTSRRTRQTARNGLWAAAGSGSVLLVVLGLGRGRRQVRGAPRGPSTA